MYYEFFQQNKRKIISGLVGLFLVITAWSTITYFSHLGKVDVYISTVPSDASVTFNSDHRGNGSQWMPAGNYSVTVKKDGFETQKQTVIVDENKKQNVVAISLVPKSAEATKWADQHQDQYKRNETYGSIEATVNGEYFTEKNPITTKLPYVDPYFTLGYVSKNNQSVALTVETPSPRYRHFAIEKLRQMGYDPTDFEIIFKDFHNPLGEVKA